MTHFVRRTCIEIRDDVHQDALESPSRPLEDFRETAVYVLLGDPGAGKTVAFGQESGGCPGGINVTARDFVALDTPPEWRDATLFIDGLDEMRAGVADGLTPFDRIRARLDALGRPAFRLSCREAYWFGTIDRTSLQRVSRDGKVTVLRLDHFTEANVREVLHHRPDIADADAFMREARNRGIGGMLANPKSLEMLADAVAGDIWPETRMETFELACRKLAREHDPIHRIATLPFDDVSVLLDAAGRLCAVMLLAGNAGYTRNPAATGDREYPGLEQFPGDDRRLLQHVLGTKLFSGPSGGAPHGLAVPVHRENAEFLAARYLGALVDDGLPAGRILSLITGHDGVVVSGLQGLAAWLAAHSRTARAELVARDSLGTILHGDVRRFSTREKRLARKPEPMELANNGLAVHEEGTAYESRIQEQDNEHTRKRRRRWHEQLKAHEWEFRENRCPPALLHVLAGAYFGTYVDVQGNTSMDRLRNLIGDESLVRLARQGLRHAIERDDLPTDTEIIRLRSRKRTHHLALPILAGLEEAARDGTERALSLDDRQMRLALAVHYTGAEPVAAPGPPRWFPPLLKSHPQVVSEILVQAVLSAIQGDTDASAKLYDLAYSEDHESIARLATLPLLRRFPVRCTDRQLAALNYLLVAALLHCERAALLGLVEEKLARRSMNVAQRVCWLTAGLVGAPDSFTKRLERFVSGNERRIRRLAELVVHRFRVPERLLEHLDVPALRALIRLTGSSFRPFSSDLHASNRDSDGSGPVTGSMEAALGIEHLIGRLASLPSPEATQALQALSSEDALRPWRSQLVDAGNRQNVLRREHGFRHCEIEQVLAVLDNRRPANVADLAALTMDRLREIARRVRDGNTSDWRQYWNLGLHNRPLEPRPENACRDALLSDLQARLSALGVDAQPEGRYAEDKQSDIRVSYGACNVPVEIKKSIHRDLWSAIRTQLIAKYTRDPGAGGYGIYLVFWLGAERCQPPERGARPKNPAELEERLRNTLSTEEARLISICVVDVSKPGT